MRPLIAILAASLALAACNGGETIPEPRAEFPKPPAILMKPPQKMRTIPVEPDAS